MTAESRWTATCVLALVALCAGLGAAAAVDNSDQRVQLLPESARHVVLNEIADGQLVGVHEVIEGRQHTYAVSWIAANGDHAGILVTASGEIVTPATDVEDDEEAEREISLGDAPEAAQKTILREANGHDLHEVEEVVVGGNTFYEADWLDGGFEVGVRVTSGGDVVGREIEAAEDESDEDEPGDDG